MSPTLLALGTSLLFLLVCSAAQEPAGQPSPQEDWVYLDNGHLRLGVLRSSGAAIAYLAPSDHSRNLLNHYDRGRLIQQSYYGDPDGSLWVQRPWRYNPVQGGDYQGAAATLVQLDASATTLHSTSIPRHWATGALLSECRMEQWITLRNDLVHVRFQFRYRGTTAHRPHHQELPAIFVDAAYASLVTYSGNAPWTNAPVSRRTPGPVNEYLPITEHWVAYLDDSGHGLGAYVPAAQEATCYRFLGASGSACSYVAPISTFALHPDLTFTYEAYFTIGTLHEIRARFTTLHRQQKPTPPQP